jgi:hypothetical protein
MSSGKTGSAPTKETLEALGVIVLPPTGKGYSLPIV